MVITNAVQMAHKLISPKLANANLVIDATTGNGNDTLFLAKNTADQTTVWAFDIQQQALAKTEVLLSQHNLIHKVRLILDSHTNIANYIEQPVDVAMFNLGYLPGSNHLVNTCPNTTIPAISQTLQLLTIGGLMTITAYPGYELGKQEYHAVHEYLTGLSQQAVAVACWSLINQTNSPPVLYVIEKKGGE